ncbi:HET-domain-containing protein [Cadophora sp. DSE1049]|nr:HET-domain-containing protein [Cadophora sp. DSE1049]
MKRCVETHRACRRTSHSPPTRLLHVGSTGDPTRLVDGDFGSSSSTSYAALSYCWGGGSFVTSTRANIAEHRCRIDWDALPRAFQDAIVVCRRLGVEHLWVDSLCIIQDDERDWELESSKMAAVYENATFVIAPTSLENPERSFFSRPQDPSLAPIILQTGGKDPPTRAWAFQEKIFATRYIWYTDAEVQWECKELVACECSAFGRDPVNPILTALTGVDPFSCWSDVVRQYTRRCLTHGKDRLPALAGVASRIQEQTGSAYVAGLWKDHLLQDLCWYPSDTQLRKARSTTRFRAPSFSWASIDGEVAFQSPETATYYVAVIDAQCMLKGANPFGEVIGGFVLLEGLLLKAWGTSDSSMQDFISLLAFSPAVDGWPNYVPWRHDVALKYGPIGTSAGDSEHGVQRCMADNSEKFELKPVWCLRLYHSECNNIWPMQTEEFLVLGLSKTVSGAYDRLGMLSIDLSNLGARKTKRALEWLEEGIKKTVKIT